MPPRGPKTRGLEAVVDEARFPRYDRPWDSLAVLPQRRHDGRWSASSLGLADNCLSLVRSECTARTPAANHGSASPGVRNRSSNHRTDTYLLLPDVR